MLRGCFGRRGRSWLQKFLYLSGLFVLFLLLSDTWKGNASVIRPQVESAPQQKQEHRETIYINNEKYPKINERGSFIPQRRIIHLDLKGAPYKPEFFPFLFSFFNRLKATGILIEWEDMFPYKGRLAKAVNSNAYNISTIEFILKSAQHHHLEVIPLVQTFGHLEWILKLKEFSHLREDSKFPQVICFSDNEGWDVIADMITQVGEVHRKYGMNYFHMGADEAFQIGICNASLERLQKETSKERLVLWHIARTARFIKEKYEVTVLAWHDMFANAMDTDLKQYDVTSVLQPVLWNYAEDLDIYLSPYTWMVLKNFGRVWVSSAWKGADGPARMASNPMHYVRNHESWITQMNNVYKEFEVVEGMIMTGWSRYDHFAVLCELLPIGIPALAFSMETILEGRPLQGLYPTTAEILECTPPTELGLVASGCKFPGAKIYELVNEAHQSKKQLSIYRAENFELNGWMSRMADEYTVSSRWYVDKIEPMIEMFAIPIERVERKLRAELSKIYFEDTVNEFIFTYLGDELEWIEKKRNTMRRISALESFPKRPFLDKSQLL